MAICDTIYCFTLADIGGYGRDNDASIISQSEMGVAFESGETEITAETELVNGYTLHYVIVSEAIFPLKPWLMKPLLGATSLKRKMFSITGCQDAERQSKIPLGFGSEVANVSTAHPC